MVFNNDIFNKFNDINLQGYNAGGVKPYIICMTPRSGSTLICDILKKTKIAGNPQEYLNPGHIKNVLLEYSDNLRLQEFLEKQIEYTKSTNNVFGIKVSYSQAYPFISNNLFMKMFPNAKYINLFRRNIVKQAISLEIAAKTKVFHSWDNQDEYQKKLIELEFDESGILKRILELIEEENGWIEFLNKNAISYMKLFYEDNIENLDRTIDKILSYIEVDKHEACSEVTSRLTKISTEKNEQFYKKIISNDSVIKKILDFGISKERI